MGSSKSDDPNQNTIWELLVACSISTVDKKCITNQILYSQANFMLISISAKQKLHFSLFISHQNNFSQPI